MLVRSTLLLWIYSSQLCTNSLNFNILQNRLQNPDFANQALAENKKLMIVLMQIANIKKLGIEYIDVSKLQLTLFP